VKVISWFPFRPGRKAAVLTAAAVALAAGAGVWGGTALAAATGPKPVTVYSCEQPGHVVVTLLSTPSAKCPAGTTSVAIGAQGPRGLQGIQGIQGVKGDTGPAVTTDFGIAKVLVDRGSGASAWATYSAPLLGSPAGDQAQGAFRFTCNGANDCKLSLQAHATVAGWSVYPRVLVLKQLAAGGPEVYCEYGDGADNNGATAALTTSDATVTLGIGGSLDCGSSQAYPADGTATEVDVPGGGNHYDVYTTLVFAKSS